MKIKKSKLTPRLRQNWWLDSVVGVSTILTIGSSLYFLAFPKGYQGGRNPDYDQIILFGRQTWDILHTWSSIVMILAIAIHVLFHWKWITRTISRTWRVIIGKEKGFGFRLTYNILVDVFIALSFSICAISGVYFLYFAPSGSTNQSFIFNYRTWDLLHIWSGSLMTIMAGLHFILHWKWVVNITNKMFIRAG